METLQLNSLAIGYRRGRRAKRVGEGLTASLPPASLTALIGRNGCGKSTLLRTIAGFQPPLAGSVFLNGKPLGEYGRRELAQTLAIVLTARPDTGMLTVREVVEMGRMPYTSRFGRLSPADHAAVSAALAQTQTVELAERALTSLSDGERQRAMIAKALAQTTPLILLDEPTAFLDYVAREEMMQLLRRLAHDAGKSILLSTHDVELAARTADRFWLLSADGISETAELPADIVQHF